jgi:hypothetical protein
LSLQAHRSWSLGSRPVPKRVVVEVLHTAGCGRWQAARDALVRVAREESIAVTLTETLVESEGQAQALRFPGSPTVRVAGHDLQPEIEMHHDHGLG